MRSMVFAKRVIKELMRDALSYIFCIGFPVFMLLLFTLINSSIPAEAQMDIFKLPSIAPGIGMFGLTFVMLFVAIQISKDRDTSFLARLYTSPMTGLDFVLGYSVPALIIAVCQMIMCFGFAAVLGIFTGEELPLMGCIRSIISLLPSAVLFIAIGILFGSLLSDKAAPAVTSIVITASSIMGGVWMPLETMSGLKKICEVFPFYHSVCAARNAIRGADLWKNEAIVIAYALILFIAAIYVFRRKMKN